MKKLIYLLLILSGCHGSAVVDEPTSIYGKVTDKDGNTYKTVLIGSQTWMAENLKTTKYNDGTSIPNVTDDKTWLALKTPAYCWFNNSISNKDNYGAYYNWYVVGTGKLCPSGWRVPSEADWNVLSVLLGDEAGITLKNHGVPEWLTPGSTITGLSGFNATATGYKNYGSVFTSGSTADYWSSDVLPAYPEYGPDHILSYSNRQLNPGIKLKYAGLSVRCVKD